MFERLKKFVEDLHIEPDHFVSEFFPWGVYELEIEIDMIGERGRAYKGGRDTQTSYDFDWSVSGVKINLWDEDNDLLTEPQREELEQILMNKRYE